MPIFAVERARALTIVALSLPITLILLSQTLISMVGIALVGHLGEAALAGVGIAGVLFSMLMAVLFGLDTGVQALVARYIGAGQPRRAGAVLNDALPFGVVVGLALCLLGYGAAPAVVRLVTADPAVVAHSLQYLHTALPMLPFLGASFAFSAYRNGAGTPRYSLLPIAVQLPCSALFSYLLVFGRFGLPRLDTAGVGLGMTLAAIVAFAVHVLLAWRGAPIPGLLQTPPSRAGIRVVVRIGLPVSVQQSLVYLGTAVHFWIIGLLGTVEVAAMNIVLLVMLLSILSASGMGIAAATLVGTALGRADAVDAARWGWEVARLGSLLVLPVSLAVVVAPRDMLGLFVTDDATIAVAAAPLRVLGLGMSVDAFGRILGFAMRGAGATRLVMTIAFGLQWAVQLPLGWYVGIHLGFGVLGIAMSRLMLLAVEAAIMTTMWRSGFWSRTAPMPP